MSRRGTIWLAVAAVALWACASPRPGSEARRAQGEAAARSQRADAVRAALSMVGAPYRHAGRSPSGFDCSGLVVYSYARAGLSGLPHSSEGLERRARPVAVDDLEPGDLIFFDLNGKKSAHVAIYVGDRSFVHAPSSGKRVEQLDFDHGYWGPRIERMGRIGY